MDFSLIFSKFIVSWELFLSHPSVNTFVLLLYSFPPTVLILVLFIIGGAAWVIFDNDRKHYKPFIESLNKRLDSLEFISENNDLESNRELFSYNFANINSAMNPKDESCPELSHAWNEFYETIVDETAAVIQTTNRPDEYFLHLGEDAKGLLFWANIAVAIGLIFTFLGIVAALTQTVHAMEGSANGDMTKAVTQLLELTSVKFWTSIAGIAASVWLRFVDRNWKKQQRKKLEELCLKLEIGTKYCSIQSLSNNQLNEQKEQTGAIKELASQLIEGFANAFERQTLSMQDSFRSLSGVFEAQTSSMQDSLQGISGHIEEFKSGSFDQIGKELSSAISNSAGSEMQQLAASIQLMSASMADMNNKMAQNNEMASKQISDAIERMNTSSEAINNKYEIVSSRIESMTHSLTSRTEEVVGSNAMLFSNAAQSMNEQYSSMGMQIDTMLKEFFAKIEYASTSNAKIFDESINSVSDKYNKISFQMEEMFERLAMQTENATSKQITDAIERMNTSSEAMNEKYAQMNLRMEEMAKNLTVQTEQAAIANINMFNETSNAAGEKFGKIGEQMAQMVQLLATQTTDATNTNNKLLSDAAQAMKEATTKASQTLNSTIEQTIAKANENSSKIMEQAFNEFGEKFRDSSSAFVSSINNASDKFVLSAGNMEKSALSIGNHANKVNEVNIATESLRNSFDKTASNVINIIRPIENSSKSIEEAVKEMHKSAIDVQNEILAQKEAINIISEKLSETSEVAKISWENYVNRFENVDKALSEVVNQIANTTREHGENLNKQTNKIDTEFARSIESLSTAITALQEYGSNIDDLLNTLRRRG